MCSSDLVGVSCARSREDFGEALAGAARYDRKVLVEAAVTGREIECAVLGNHDPEGSPLGEIRPTTEFYDYNAKYLDDSAELLVPAAVDAAAEARVRELAVHAYRALDCAGLARVDFLLEPDGGVKCIEVNTLPGFTPISMYPRLWQHAGVTYCSHACQASSECPGDMECINLVCLYKQKPVRQSGELCDATADACTSAATTSGNASACATRVRGSAAATPARKIASRCCREGESEDRKSTRLNSSH